MLRTHVITICLQDGTKLETLALFPQLVVSARQAYKDQDNTDQDYFILTKTILFSI